MEAEWAIVHMIGVNSDRSAAWMVLITLNKKYIKQKDILKCKVGFYIPKKPEKLFDHVDAFFHDTTALMSVVEWKNRKQIPG